MRGDDNRWHEAYREPLPLERQVVEAHYRALVQMERTAGAAKRMVLEAFQTTATMLGDTTVAGRLWGLHDHLKGL